MIGSNLQMSTAAIKTVFADWFIVLFPVVQLGEMEEAQTLADVDTMTDEIHSICLFLRKTKDAMVE